MPLESTHPSLLHRLRDSSDERAWRSFHTTYGDFILRYALKRGLDLPAAEDVRQNVLIALMRTFPNFEYRRERGRFRAYLAATVRHAVSKQRTRQVRPAEVPLMDEALPADADAADDPIWDEEWMAHHVRAAFAALHDVLEPRSLMVFSRLLNGEKPQAIAADTDMNVDAIYKIKQRVRERMQVLVATQLEEENA